jgi:hypothetical protein
MVREPQRHCDSVGRKRLQPHHVESGGCNRRYELRRTPPPDCSARSRSALLYLEWTCRCAHYPRAVGVITLRNEITDSGAIDAVTGPGKLTVATDRVPPTPGLFPVVPGMKHHATGATNLHVHGFAVPPVKCKRKC